MVQPAQETHKGTLWLSNADLLMPRMHTPSVYFYRPNGSTNFFEPQILKVALSKALVHLYPMAGRLKGNVVGRIEIECNGKGVLFIEAKTDAVLDDLGDFATTMRLKPLVPTVDSKEDFSSYVLLVLQVTRFRCGGVSLGVRMQHYVANGASGLHFINHWSDVARGLDLHTPPFFDRTLLQACDPALPPGYFGNAVFMATLTVAVGDITSNPLIYAATRMDDALERMDDEYSRSILDFLELQSGPTATIPGVHMFRSHAMTTINSWYRLPIYDADSDGAGPYLWGPVRSDSRVYFCFIPGPIDDGSLSLVISLEPDHGPLQKVPLQHVKEKDNPIRETSSIFGNMELLDLVRHLNKDCCIFKLL